MRTAAALIAASTLLAPPPALAGKVCQQFAEPEPPPGLADCRNLHYHHTSDTIYQIYRNGQIWEGSFPILDVAKGYIENDGTGDCFTIKEVPACVWGDSGKP